ncbi:MAG: transketolase [Bdellovibrionales bacterium]|nr:transketolase [Bdellovibrionales bacterium]
MNATSFTDLDRLCVNTIRTLSIDAIQKADSGHPGLPLGAAPMAYVLWQSHLRHCPSDPTWPDRDRFVLSAGHGSMLLYSLLHLTGYDLPMSEIQAFRQWKSRTPGHPEFGHTAGVEATTGPLGQGSANAVGMAMAERALAHRFNRAGFELVNHMTYALVSDGDLMEGVAAEAGSLAGHLKLGKLVYLYDANDVTLDGPTSMTFSTEDVARRYESYGWQVLWVMQGDTDLAGLDAAIRAARAETAKPSLIIVKTTIGFGSPNRQGTSESHGKPLGAEELELTKKALGWAQGEAFHVPSEARARFDESARRGRQARDAWNQLFDRYSREFPELAKEWKQAQAGALQVGWEAALPTWKPGEKLATRLASGKAIQAVAKAMPSLIGGDADLSCSTNTLIAEGGSFEGQKGSGRNVHYGVREHAMTSIANGMCYHGGVRPFVSTFFVFSDYMRPAIRLAAMNHLPAIYVWTHDSLAVGEDGPTHQPIEHLASLRAMPGLVVLRPACANETREAWKIAAERLNGPTALVLTRQALPSLAEPSTGWAVHRGAYVAAEAEGGTPDAILIGTGSELHVALAARTQLAAQGVRARVVSMPSWELFAAQDGSYREAVLPKSVRARVSVEAGATFGWQRWIGDQGVAVGIDRYGASAPGGTLLKEFGFTPENVAAAALRSLGR